MRRYADPAACPDCRTPLPPGSARCPACRLSLTGPLPRELFATLARADELLTALRATSAVTAPPVPSGASGPAAVSSAVRPSGPAGRPAPGPSGFRLTGAAIPRILLGVGALCLLVAAVVFSVVAWHSLGLGARTAVLAAATALAAGTASWSVRRTLRAAAEALTAVTAGLVALDLAGAVRAGWLPISALGATTLTGGVLLVLGIAAAATAQRGRLPRLVAAESAAALGLVLLTAAGAVQLAGPWPLVELAGLAVAAAAAGTAYMLRLRVLAPAAAVVAVGWWSVLLLDGLVSGLEHPSVAGLAAHGWPVVVAAVVLAAPAASTRLPQALRTGLVGGGLALLTVLAGIPAVDEPVQAGTLVAVAVLALGALGAVALPRRWAPAVTGSTGLAGLAALVVALLHMVRVAERLVTGEVWSQPAGVPLPATPVVPGWPVLLAPTVAALALAGLALARLAQVRIERLALVEGGIVGGTLTATATLAAYDVPRWSVLAVLLMGALGVTSRGPARRATTIGAGVLVLAAVVVALPSAGLSVPALAAVVVLAVLVELTGPPALRQVAQAVLPVAVGTLAVAAGLVAGVAADPRALVAVVAVGLLVVVRPTVPLTGSALATVIVIVLAAGSGTGWVAVDLLVAGALGLTAGLVHRRPVLVWGGVGLVLAGSWVRLADLGVSVVDAYTLPLAVLLLAVGLHRMRRHGADSLPALAPGLTLALTPTLLLALAEPVSWRALILGVACTGLVLAGTGLRWSAPLVFGAGAGVLLVLGEAGQGDVVPQWVAIGVIGLLLTVLGVTWERRLHDLRVATGYLRGLR